MDSRHRSSEQVTLEKVSERLQVLGGGRRIQERGNSGKDLIGDAVEPGSGVQDGLVQKFKTRDW